MPSPDANSTWFHFSIPGGSQFAVFAFSGVERVNRPYSFTIDLASLYSGEHLFDLVGQEACLSIADRSGASRLVHGVIREMEQLHTANLRTCYRCTLVPRLWFLGSRRNHRIFQHKSVPDIITYLLGEQGFARDSFAFKCFHDYPAREYCVQYGESDLHFISRLCEEEGIYYYFEHAQNGHCLCFSDMPGGPDIPGGANLLYRFGAGLKADAAVITDLRYHVAARGDSVTFREWNFEKYWADLTVGADEPDRDKAPVPPRMIQEDYRYPHLYGMKEPGRRYAGIQLQRERVFTRWIDGSADVARLLPGFTFVVERYPRHEVNDRWWVTVCMHRGEQPQVLEHEAPERGSRYAAAYQAIPATTLFVPEEHHPKIRIPNKQTAIVTGPPKEEIHTDKYGRVKLRFFWDRRDKEDGGSSRWVRVSQGWAGREYGCMAIPRIGQEVIVSFLEGDPDRPLVTGRVYNARNLPPYELPAHKTRTVFRSFSTPGGEGPRGFNEFRIEDKTGEEEIFIQAQKDANLHVKNDWKEHILRDRHRTVDSSTFLHTRGETHEILHGQRKTELFNNNNLTVHGDSHSDIQGSWLGEAGLELHLEAGIKIVLEAGAELELRAGGSSMVLNDAGIFLNGQAIDLNSGGTPGTGTPAAPLLPLKGARAEAPPAPNAGCFSRTARSRGAVCLLED